MERLTEKVFEFVQLKACGNDFCKETCAEHDEEKSCKNCHIQKAFEKLAQYEDLDEQGLLLRLPCKVGDTVYAFLPSDNHFSECQINKIQVKPTIYGKMCYLIEPIGRRGHLYRYYEYDFGKTVFLTQAEAEQKLKEMESD